MKRKGEITVYLSLSMLILLSMLLALVSSSLDRAMRMRTEIAMDTSLQSIFAEYNRQLLSQYDLFFIDNSYCSTNGNIFNTEEHLKKYLDNNLNVSKGFLSFYDRNLFNLNIDNVNVLLFSLATDDNAQVYKRQAIQAVKDRYGAAIIEDLKKTKSSYKSHGISNYNVTEKRNVARQEMYNRASNATDANGNKIAFDDPTKDMESQRSGIITTLLSMENISSETINNSSLPSNRRLNTGYGIIECNENLNSVTNNLFFTEYISWKFSCYTNSLNKKGLQYEQEYILKNKTSDYKNLNAVAKDLLLLRETANVIYLFNDSTKRAEAKAVAATIAALLLMPEIIDILTDVLLFSWGFAESCVDVHTLLKGGRVPLMKSSSTWILSLSDSFFFKLHLSDGLRVRQGMNYSTYLKLFLILENSDNKLYRSLDIIEKNLRNTKGNSNFKIDNCIEYLDAQATVTGKNKFKVTIRRYFGYVAMPKITI